MSEIPNRTTDRARGSRVNILGICLDKITLNGVVDRITQACNSREPLQIVTVNLNFLTVERKLPGFRDVINNSGLSVCDGRILKWVSKILGNPLPSQITGHDIFRECVSLANENNYGIFLLGGGPGVAADLAGRLESRYPGLRAKGTDHGMFSISGHTDHQEELSNAIKEYRPEFLFVALGCPKQDNWIANHLPQLGVPVAVGVGCVFDVETGRMKRAPRWMQIAGLESVFQLFDEPGRYAKRYLIDDPPTVARIVLFIIRTWISRFHPAK